MYGAALSISSALHADTTKSDKLRPLQGLAAQASPAHSNARRSKVQYAPKTCAARTQRLRAAADFRGGACCCGHKSSSYLLLPRACSHRVAVRRSSRSGSAA